MTTLELMVQALIDNDHKKFNQLKHELKLAQITLPTEKRAEDGWITVKIKELWKFDFAGIRMNYVRFEKCDFGAGSLADAYFDDCVFNNCTFASVDARRLHFNECLFEGCLFEGIKLRSVEIIDCSLTVDDTDQPTQFKNCAFKGFTARLTGWHMVEVSPKEELRRLQALVVRGIMAPKIKKN